MNNVLIIGNGFDRQLGLKTDYISFLDWIENQNYSEYGLNKVLESFYKLGNPAGSITQISNFLDLVTSDSYESRSFAVEYNKIHWNDSPYSNEHNYSLKLMRLLLLTKKALPNKEEEIKINLWFSYFNFLRKYYLISDKASNSFFSVLFLEHINNEGRWIDLESLIEANLRHIINNPVLTSAKHINIYTFTKYLLICDGERWEGDYSENKKRINQFLWEDFLEFKRLLVTYLNQQFDKKSYLETYSFQSEKLNISKIINFNYTNSLGEIVSNGYLFHNKPVIYNIHGRLEDAENIVFGLDSFLRDLPAMDSDGKSSEEIRLLNDEDYLKFTKIHQLLVLQKEKQSENIGVVDTLTIIGHSIGIQDYSYFNSILDRNFDRIIIEYYYYKYSNGAGDNKVAGQDAIFRLMNSYEKYSGKRVFHKMIFEGRIKFKEINLPIIFK